MQRTLKYFFLLGLFIFAQLAHAQNHCPDVRTISRVQGEYAWKSTDGRWEGYFASPRYGRGESSHIKSFRQSRWMQLTNLNEALGMVECDYLGNYGDEVIRFAQVGTAATPKPQSTNWACQYNPSFPGIQCTCSGEAAGCSL